MAGPYWGAGSRERYDCIPSSSSSSSSMQLRDKLSILLPLSSVMTITARPRVSELLANETLFWMILETFVPARLHKTLWNCSHENRWTSLTESAVHTTHTFLGSRTLTNWNGKKHTVQNFAWNIIKLLEKKISSLIHRHHSYKRQQLSRKAR